MAIKFNPILGTLLVVVVTVLLHVSDARRDWKEAPHSKPVSGGWKPIPNITNEVIEIGKFAVDEHNKEVKTKLEFQKVWNGESQVVEGINYRLVITAKDGDLPHFYVAGVWVKPAGKSRNLTSFEKCEEFNGGSRCTYE